MRTTVRSAARERDWAIVAGSYAMHPRSSERLKVRTAHPIGAARRDQRSPELGLLALLRSTPPRPAVFDGRSTM